MRRFWNVVACALALPLIAMASPYHHPGGGGGPAHEGPGSMSGAPSPERSVKRRVAMAAIQLGEILDYDSARTVKLVEQLQPFAERQLALRQESREVRLALHQAAEGKGGDVAALTRRLLDGRENRVKLQRELVAALTKGLPADKAARVALFVAHMGKIGPSKEHGCPGCRGGGHHGRGPGGGGQGCPRCQQGMMGPQGGPGGPSDDGDDVDDEE